MERRFRGRRSPARIQCAEGFLGVAEQLDQNLYRVLVNNAACNPGPPRVCESLTGVPVNGVRSGGGLDAMEGCVWGGRNGGLLQAIAGPLGIRRVVTGPRVPVDDAEAEIGAVRLLEVDGDVACRGWAPPWNAGPPAPHVSLRACIGRGGFCYDWNRC